ncbi:MAG: peptidylprolyl isomerase [Myxococcota bacterium]|nr:peptidylprolyl isomerase [Myxococcota bacterium]
MAAVSPPAASEKKPAGAEQYATFETTLGKFVVRLFPADAPKTVQNFVELAEGKKEWTDPRTNKVTRAKLYDGTVFHRVIPDFMIQGGDPLGQGVGGPGYQFEDEFQSGRRFDKPGLLAMANRGPNTNGSQFFITTSTPSHLNDHHTIFGEVVEGYDVVLKISTAQTAARNKPAQDVVIKKVVISSKRP